MDFRTVIDIKKSVVSISYADKLMLMGSCFAENIGKRLVDYRFKTDVNPFGILYNPLSVEESVKILLNKRLFTKNDLFPHNGLWNSFFHHGSFSDVSAEVCLHKINQRILKSSELLSNAGFLIITLGTAWVYELKETGRTVANCHKLPEKLFHRRRLSVQEITDRYTSLLNGLKEYNKGIQVIFTVSPIRHWKDGAHENQLSKSTLLLAIDHLQQLFSNVHYFPAYEIVMDELRDYRFYADDMIHVNNTTVDYIWEKFASCYFSPETNKITQEVLHIIKAESHKPFNPDSQQHKNFLNQIAQKKDNLRNQYPDIDL